MPDCWQNFYVRKAKSASNWPTDEGEQQEIKQLPQKRASNGNKKATDVAQYT